MATPKQARTAQTAGHPGGGHPGGGKARDKGTRGGRPEPRQAVTPTRRPGNGQPGPQRAQASRQPAARAREAAAVPDGPVIRPAPLWFQLTTWVLAAGGLGGSIYLTIAHYNTTVTLACPATSHINCERVTTSPESIVFGIPVAVLGLAFYVFMIAATSPWAWRATGPQIRGIQLGTILRWARVGTVIAGMVFVLYLIYTELFTLNLTICLWCTGVHVITFLLFGLIMFAFAVGYGTPQPPSRR
ncbi:MAG TPA: hypothetical protein DHU96_22150 [Actinobacteria bacterium]|nr:hypothetical protein [Actinomycetota bacterium]